MGQNSPVGYKSSANKWFSFSRIMGAEDGEKDTVYMTRLTIGRLRFHLFHRGDQDPDCHDHPWGFWTFPLRSYVEEVLEERVRVNYGAGGPVTTTTYFERRMEVVKAWRWHYRPATYRHRVIGAYDGWAVDLPPGSFPEEPEKFLLVPAVNLTKTVPTIVWREPISRKWGFTKERSGKWCWVPWKDYVFADGKDAACNDD